VELLNAIELVRAAQRHTQVGPWLAAWRAGAQSATWRSLVDVRRSYPATDGVPLGHGMERVIVTVFNAGGNDYRLLTRISYAKQLIQIEEVLTHAEYSKNKWKRRYE
jgi:mRNA interferase HigB